MISQTTEYALRAATALAAGPAAPRTGRSLAAETRIPRGYLTKVLAPLVRACLVQANRGAGGGYTLRRDPATVPLIDVLHAVQPPAPRPAGQTAPMCALHQRIEQATARFEQAFEHCTLADLATPRGADAAGPGRDRVAPKACIRCRADDAGPPAKP